MLKSQQASLENIQKLGLNYKIHIPQDAVEGPRPALFMVHGRAGTADVMWVFAKAVGNVKPIIITPEAFIEDPVGGYSWWSIFEEDGSRKPRTTADDLRVCHDKLENFIESAIEVYNLDENRLYAFGFSQGAGIISSLSLKRPNLFKGVALLAGFIPTIIFDEAGFIAESVKQKRTTLADYFIAHGSEDNIIPFNRAEFARDTLESYGANVELFKDSTKHKVGSAGIKALTSWFETVASTKKST